MLYKKWIPQKYFSRSNIDNASRQALFRHRDLEDRKRSCHKMITDQYAGTCNVFSDITISLCTQSD